MEGAVNVAGESTGISNMNDIVDDLHEIFDSKVIKDELRLLGMFDLVLSQDGADELVDDNGKHIFINDFTLKFYNRLKVGE